MPFTRRIQAILPVVASVMLLVGALAGHSVSAADILHEEQSLYSQIIVKKTGRIVCLQFSVKSELRNQSCIKPKDPKDMVFAYTKMTMASLLFTPNPKRIAIIGLGGGTLPMAFTSLFPEAKIDAVEIDPAVVRIAKDYFGFKPTKNIAVHTQDARVWTKRAQLRGLKFDLIVLDAFNGEYIPEHLMTREYLEETRSLLSEGGTLISNTFAISNLYDHESATYADVFGEFINFQVPESANRVILYSTQQVSDEALTTRAKTWVKKLRPFDVPITRYARILKQRRNLEPDWRTDARLLTDQYSPANLLQAN